MNTTDIHQVLNVIKKSYESAITTGTFNGNTYENGLRAKEALIRSQQLINLLHNVVKDQLLGEGVNPDLIIPPPGKSQPEQAIEGFLKRKNQDVCVVPRTGVISDQVIAINIRSQLSSMMKNIDTLYERTFAESLNLHLKFPAMCTGEVYLIPTHEYDDKAMLSNKIAFKKVTKLERYIQMFQAINARRTIQGDEYKYERVCLLVVDFTQTNPVLYSTADELVKDGLLPHTTTATMEGLEFDSFTKDLLVTYGDRFDANLILAT